MSRKTRKLIWSAPLVAVLAVAGALAIFAAATPGGVFADALPGAPMNLTAEADGWYAIDLDWDPPSSGAPDGYRIDMSKKDGFIWETLVMDTGNSRTNYTDEYKLKAETNRHYRVFALNSHGAGRVSIPTSEVTDDAEVPKKVTGLRARNNGQDKIELSWTDPTNTGGLDIVQYCIRWSTAIGTMPTNCDEVDDEAMGVILVDAEEATSPSCFAEPAGDVSMGTYIDTDLDPGTTRHYEIVVITREDDDQTNTDDEEIASEASDTAVDTTDGAEKPGAPTILTAVPIDGNDINLYWYTPEKDGGADINGYRVEVRKEDERWPEISENPGRGAQTASFTDVNDNDVFRTMVVSEDTQLIQFTVTTNLTDKLEFRVFAENGGVTGDGIRTSADSSNTVEVTPAVAPGRPMGHSVTASTGLDGQINVTITPPTDEPTHYRIDSSEDGRNWEAEVSNTRFTRFENNVYEDVNLDPDVTRFYRVFILASNGRDLGPAAMNEVAGTTKGSTSPGEVKNLEAEGVSASQIDLSWDAPDDTGGRTIDKYQIERADPLAEGELNAGAVNAMTWGDLACQVGSTTEYSDMDDLEINTKKFYRVVAINSEHPEAPAADSPDTPSDEMAAALMAALVASATTEAGSAPGMVIGLTAEQASDSSGPTTADTGTVLLWNKPSTAAGGAVEGYIVERSDDSGTSWDEIADEDDTGTARTDWTDPDHLPAGESRMYRVSAKNSAGTSATATIGYLGYHDPPAGHSHDTTATGTLGEVSDVTATSDTDGEVTVMWMGGDNADRYFIIALEQGSSPLVIGFERAESGESEATITGLNSDASHFVIVLALKGTGDDRELEYDTDTVTVQ